MSYSLATLWYERQRYLPGVLAVGFSALLIVLQFGLLKGTLGPNVHGPDPLAGKD